MRQRAYCARHGLSYTAFGYWRNRVHEKPAAPAFVPVVIEPPEVAALPVAWVPWPPAGGTGLEIRLTHGRTIVVAPDFDAAVLARVIRVLEQVPC